MSQQFEILKQICENRKSIRRFSDKKVSSENIENILKIAHTSPYASGRKNWEIQVIDDKAMILAIAQSVKNHSAEMIQNMKEDMQEGFRNYTKSFTFFENAPALFILTFRVTPAMAFMLGENCNNEILQWERDNYTKSISCVAMLVLLAAQSLGLGSCYMTGPIIAQKQILEIIHAKVGREIGAIIPVGYAE